MVGVARVDMAGARERSLRSQRCVAGSEPSAHRLELDQGLALLDSGRRRGLQLRGAALPAAGHGAGQARPALLARALHVPLVRQGWQHALLPRRRTCNWLLFFIDLSVVPCDLVL